MDIRIQPICLKNKNKMKRKSKIIIGLMLLSIGVWSQSTFNIRTSFNRPVPSVLSSILVEDTCYYISGLTIDTIPPYRLGSLFGKLDLAGELLDLRIQTDSNTTTQLWRNTLTKTGDGDFTVTGSFTDALSTASLLLKLNTEGDTVFRKIYRSPNYPLNSFIVLLSSLKTGDEGYLLLNNISGASNNTNIYLIKTDSIGNKEWEQVYGGPALSESSGSIIEVGNNKYIIGGVEHNINLVGSNYKSRTYLFQIDNIGNVEWEYKSPEGVLQYNANDILQSPDGGLVIASTKGIEQTSGPNSYFETTHYIYKIDANQEFEWGVDIRDTFPSSENMFSKLIAPADGSGYIAAGTIFEFTGGGGYNINGILTKISTTGDSLWTRYYSHVDSPADNHIFYDVEETPDGGFVMVGQATDNMTTGELPLQQAWIVKVDQHGCLVPGCHLIDDVESPQIDVQISLYPNPTRDYLNIFYYHPNHRGKVTYQIVDIQGRVLRSFERSRNNITHMISLGDLVSGQYFLRLENEEGKVVTRTFVKE